MRRTLLTVTVFIMLAASTGAVVGANQSWDNNSMHIMGGGSSASASTGVGPNGTTFHAEVAQANSSCSTGGNDSLSVTGKQVSRPGDTSDGTLRSVTFHGRITAGTPCHTLDHTVTEREGDVYVLNVQTVAGDGACVQCVGTIQYTGSFEAPAGYRLIVQHEGEHVRTVTVTGSDTLQQDPSPLDQFLAWITGLF